MTSLDRALRQVVNDLRRSGVDFALVGGLAVTIRGHERLTRDVDIAVAISGDEQAESLIHGLIVRGYLLETLLEHTATERLATARFSAPPRARTTALIDILFASTGIEPEIVRDADVVEVRPGIKVKVARLADLIAMKVLSRDDQARPQDQQDLLALLGEASSADLRAARRSLRLIEGRGFHRRRRLLVDLDRALKLAKRIQEPFRERAIGPGKPPGKIGSGTRRSRRTRRGRKRD